MLPGAGWYMILVFLMLMESPRLLICFCKEVKACLKLFYCVGKTGTVISILKLYNGCLYHFDLESTQVEKSPIEPVINFNSPWEAVEDKKEKDT